MQSGPARTRCAAPCRAGSRRRTKARTPPARAGRCAFNPSDLTPGLCRNTGVVITVQILPNEAQCDTTFSGPEKQKNKIQKNNGKGQEAITVALAITVPEL